MAPSFLQDIFSRLQAEEDKKKSSESGEGDGRSYRLQLSYLEIYKEEVREADVGQEHGRARDWLSL